MSVLFLIILSTFLVSLIAFIGIVILFLKEELLNKILLGLVAFSAGALLGGAFLHLLPEAIEGAGETDTLKIFLFLILGFITFFVLEHFIRWHHHHAKKHPEIMPFSYLVLVSDAVHNFIDGVVIAAAFVVAVPLGVVTTLAVILHEIPQEIGDFGILVYGGFKRTRALFLNFVSAVVAVIGGLAGFFLSEKIGEAIIFLLPFAAGNFIYIAASDLIPEIKQKASSRKSIIHFFIFLLGLSLMLSLKLI
ncbi:MAG: ZIP family metal transporter [Candidatus Nealsonbacteria bacterium CG09_land_8_20_14_0_10_42_14]|uniref:ZIP family metal transporter n=1 Tax=Candidatus Nealsonbacteria bacterium CG09_land_8_20_14_0_10_42_14 TaxID=1974707 RepID=A0A2H0WXU5_9BACT|nr:MAG: ZIP family metal transporter [Candidatus Nealsonbacteria bacterium CG09_land_8_20_14_0_10_42_14]